MSSALSFDPLRKDLRAIVREWGLMHAHPCVPELTLVQGHALIELEGRSRSTIADLAQALTLDHSTASRLVSKLVAKGYLAQRTGRADARNRELTLTKRGREILKKLHRESNSRVEKSLAVLTPEEQATVQTGLALYAKAMAQVRRQGVVEIRPIRRRDDKAMANVIRTVMPEFGADGPGFAIHDAEVDTLTRSYSAKRHGYFVVVKDGRVVGGGGFGPLKGEATKACELRKMYLLPEARGCGLGEALLRKCLAEAKKSGFKQCYLETTSRMIQAQGLYQKLGFAPLSGPKGKTGHFACDRWYIKDL